MVMGWAWLDAPVVVPRYRHILYWVWIVTSVAETLARWAS